MTTKDTKEIGEKIRGLRFRHKLSQVGLGRLAGCTGSYINRVESGAVAPSLDFAFKVESALKLPDNEISSMVIKTIYAKATKKAMGEETSKTLVSEAPNVIEKVIRVGGQKEVTLTIRID